MYRVRDEHLHPSWEWNFFDLLAYYASDAILCHFVSLPKLSIQKVSQKFLNDFSVTALKSHRQV
jgi:hypothetical protein